MSKSKAYTITISPADNGACPSVTPPTKWTGDYYANPNLAGSSPALTRSDGSIDFNWGGGSPAPGIANSNYSVRWTRTTSFAAGNYTFKLDVDVGGRLKIDGSYVIGTSSVWATTSSVTQTFATTGPHTIVVEYHHLNSGGAHVSLDTTVLTSNGVLLDPIVLGNATGTGKDRIAITNSSDDITAMAVTMWVALTPAGMHPEDISDHGMGGDLTETIDTTSCSGFIKYTFTLDAGKTISRGNSGNLTGQWNTGGGSTPHVTYGDSWTVTTTTSRGTQTMSGYFPGMP